MVTPFLELAVGCSVLLTLHSLINGKFFLLTTNVTNKSSADFDILIPARNEERNIKDCVTSAVAQLVSSKSQVLVMDDNSTDNTSSILESLASDSVKIFHNEQIPPAGWLGKNWACHQLSEHTKAEYLVFIDADVVLNPAVVPQVIGVMQKYSLDLVSPYPRQVTKGILGKLIQPLLQWSWLTTVPLRIARKSRRTSFAVANGQFMVVNRQAYLACQGHLSVKAEVLDDIELLRSLLKHGFNGSVIDGTNLAACTMYQNGRELIDGYSKSLWCAFGGPLGSIASLGFLTFVYIAPLLGLFNNQVELALTGWLSGCAGRLIVGRRTGQSNLGTALLHPLSIACFVYLNLVSWSRHIRGELVWKGRAL